MELAMATVTDRTHTADRRRCGGDIKARRRRRARLSVFRSSKHIYAQVIDDLKGETLASPRPRSRRTCAAA